MLWEEAVKMSAVALERMPFGQCPAWIAMHFVMPPMSSKIHTDAPAVE